MKLWSRHCGVLMAAAAISVPTGVDAQATAFPPFSFAEVDFTRKCEPNDAMSRLLTVLTGPTASAPADDQAPVFDEPLMNAVSGNTLHRLVFDEAVEWHGLHLTQIEVYQGIERGPTNYSLIFFDPPEKVREVWNARGWNLPPVGEARDIEGLENYASIMVDARQDGRVVVGCFRD